MNSDDDGRTVDYTVYLLLHCVAVVSWFGLKRDLYAKQFNLRLSVPCWVVSEKVDTGTNSRVPMVRKLFCKKSVPRAVNALKVEGIVPSNLFELKSSTTSVLREPTLPGMDPVIEF